MRYIAAPRSDWPISESVRNRRNSAILVPKPARKSDARFPKLPAAKLEGMMATLRLIFIYSVPVVIFLATLEALVFWFRKRGDYDWRAYLASMADLLVRQYFVYTLLPLGLADPVIAWAWTHRIATVPLDAVGAFVALFLGRSFATTGFTAVVIGCAGCGRRMRCIILRTN
jgi:hypothetical protein